MFLHYVYTHEATSSLVLIPVCNESMMLPIAAFLSITDNGFSVLGDHTAFLKYR
jgi:hypothetical protein